MKKLLFILLFAAASGLTVSCTEDDSVVPTTQNADDENTGGVDDKGKI